MRPAAKQTELSVGVCGHETLEEVRSEGGTLMAERCATCTTVVAVYGKCDGCKKDGRLVRFVSTKGTPKRYHGDACRQRANKEKREKTWVTVGGKR